MTIIAGFDIGILNLAFCIIDTDKWCKYTAGKSNDPGILAWENLNLIGDGEKCAGKIKNGCKCECNAKWIDNGIHYCGKHAVIKTKKYIPKNTKNVNINILREAVVRKLDSFSIFNTVSKIVIESQPRVNQRMKMFAASIETYFIIRYKVDSPDACLRSIIRSPAKNKLSVYTGPKIDTTHIKDPYAARKYLAQAHTESLLNRAGAEVLKAYTDSCKRDDLADAFLHTVLAITQK